MKPLYESLFDVDLATKKPAINGVPVDNQIWTKCEKYFKSVLKKYKKVTSEKDVYVVEFRGIPFKILYAYNDCIIWLFDDTPSDGWMYVLSPETIYINYMSIEHNAKNNQNITHIAPIDINHLDEYNSGGVDSDRTLSFIAKVNKFRGENPWSTLEGIAYSIPSPREEGIGSNLLCRGYLPITISQKAKNIIQKYVK